MLYTQVRLGRAAEGNTLQSQTHVTGLGERYKNFRKHKSSLLFSVLVVINVREQKQSPALQQPCCSTSHAPALQPLITREEVELEVWVYEKDKRPGKTRLTPPLIFNDQLHLPKTKEQHINSSALQVLFVLLAQGNGSSEASSAKAHS